MDMGGWASIGRLGLGWPDVGILWRTIMEWELFLGRFSVLRRDGTVSKMEDYHGFR
jgi:hypothetical protein